MDRNMQVKRLANAIFAHIYRSYNSAFDHAVKLPVVFNDANSAKFYEDISKSILHVCVVSRPTFSSAFNKSFSFIKSSDKQFMMFLTDKCLKLCTDDVFLSFVVVCAFISELNLYCVAKGCFTFMNTAPKCLIAIFNRQMKKEFYALGGIDGLKSFCASYLQTNGNNLTNNSEQPNGDDAHNHLEGIIHRLESSSSSDSDESEENSDSEMSDSTSSSEYECTDETIVKTAKAMEILESSDDSSDSSGEIRSSDEDSSSDSEEESDSNGSYISSMSDVSESTAQEGAIESPVPKTNI